MPTARAVELIEKALGECRCRHLTLSGGEPLLRDDLEALVAAAFQRGAQVTVSTNGRLLGRARIESLLSAGAGHFEIALNAADADIHDRMAGRQGSFANVTQAAAELRARGGRLTFTFVATKQNIEQWPEVVRLGMSLGVRTFQFCRWNASGEGRADPAAFMPEVDQLARALEIANDFVERFELSVGVPVPIPPCLFDVKTYPQLCLRTCTAGSEQAHYTLDPLGNVRPCVHSALVLGNLFESNLRDLVRSPAMASFKAARPTFCHGCRDCHECQGGCKASAVACYGSLNACDPLVELNKSRVSRPSVVEISTR